MYIIFIIQFDFECVKNILGGPGGTIHQAIKFWLSINGRCSPLFRILCGMVKN